MLCFFAAKGGVGCSLVTAAAAVLSSRSRPTLLVDLAGDLDLVLGARADELSSDVADACSPPGRLGLSQWFKAVDPTPHALRFLEVPVVDGLGLLPLGSAPVEPSPERTRELADHLLGDGRQVFVDLGLNSSRLSPVPESGDRRLLVTRACYLALRAAARGPRPDGVVLIDEPGRALSRADVARAVDAPVVATVPWQPAIARVVDAGLLASRVPGALKRLADIGQGEEAP